MGRKAYNKFDWAPVPWKPLRIAEMDLDGSSGITNGNPISINFRVTHERPNAGCSIMGSGGAGDEHGGSAFALFVAMDADDLDGIHYVGNTSLIFDPEHANANTGGIGIFAGEISAMVFAEVGTPMNVYMELGYGENSITTDSPPTGAPDGIFPPTNLVAEFIADHVHLTWLDNSDNELGFKIEWSTVPAVTWTEFAEVPAGVSEYDDYAVETDQVYSYRVHAFKSDKRSIDSNVAETTLPLVLSPTTGSASGSTEFEITGPFGSGTSATVMFGGIAATDIEVTSNKITGRTPAHEVGVVDVTVQYGSTTETLEDAFTYTSGQLYPHLEVSDPQVFAPPIPSAVVLVAEVVDDPTGLFDDATYLWEQIGGESCEIEAPTSLSTSVVASTYVPGVYLFRVTATAPDNAGQLTNTAQVTMRAASAPIVTPLMLTTRFPDSITIDPTVQDDGWNGPVTYAWTQVGGVGNATIVSPASRSTEIQFPNTPGTYTFMLSASNDEFSGTGIIKIMQYTSASPPPITSGDLSVTVNGVSF